jgi:hypothetical protein
MPARVPGSGSFGSIEEESVGSVAGSGVDIDPMRLRRSSMIDLIDLELSDVMGGTLPRSTAPVSSNCRSCFRTKLCG